MPPFLTRKICHLIRGLHGRNQVHGLGGPLHNLKINVFFCIFILSLNIFLHGACHRTPAQPPALSFLDLPLEVCPSPLIAGVKKNKNVSFIISRVDYDPQPRVDSGKPLKSLTFTSSEWHTSFSHSKPLRIGAFQFWETLTMELLELQYTATMQVPLG